MTKSNKRKRLLIELEQIIGSSCYNGNIKNYGPWGHFEGEGREFRYPLVTVSKSGERQRTKCVKPTIPLAQLRGAYYAFGANQLHIIRALEQVLNHLETKYKFKL